MPLKLLQPSFLDRIKERAINRIKTELAPTTPQPQDDGVPEQEDVPLSFGERIKQKVKEKIQDLKPVQNRMLDPNARLDDATLKYRIRYCGQNRLLALLSYQGSQTRFVECYSYRFSNGTPRKMFLMGFCRLHGRIHKFDLQKITGFVVTETGFRGRWPIEL